MYYLFLIVIAEVLLQLLVILLLPIVLYEYMRTYIRRPRGRLATVLLEIEFLGMVILLDPFLKLLSLEY